MPPGLVNKQETQCLETEKDGTPLIEKDDGDKKVEQQPAPLAPMRKKKMVLLVEPKSDQNPTVRRRGKGKRRIDTNEKGKIQNYFSKTICTKEWDEIEMKEGASGNGPAVLRKRKAMEDGLGDRDDGSEHQKAAKAAKSTEETINYKLLFSTTSSGETNSFLRTESSIWRGGKDDGQKGAKDWMGLREMEIISGKTPEGFEDKEDFYINTQRF